MSWSDGKRVYSDYRAPRTLGDLVKVRHGRDLNMSLERIMRPTTSTPRRAADWR